MACLPACLCLDTDEYNNIVGAHKWNRGGGGYYPETLNPYVVTLSELPTERALAVSAPIHPFTTYPQQMPSTTTPWACPACPTFNALPPLINRMAGWLMFLATKALPCEDDCLAQGIDLVPFNCDSSAVFFSIICPFTRNVILSLSLSFSVSLSSIEPKNHVYTAELKLQRIVEEIIFDRIEGGGGGEEEKLLSFVASLFALSILRLFLLLLYTKSSTDILFSLPLPRSFLPLLWSIINSDELAFV